MNQEFKPGSLFTKISIATFSLPAIAFLLRPQSALLGIIFLLFALSYLARFIFNYRKYVMTDNSLQVVDWSGTVKSEIVYSEMANVFLHKSYGQTGGIMKTDIEKETLVIDLIQGGTARFDISPIDNSDELVALVKSKWVHEV